jgi:subtilase family serine protease
LHFRASAVVFIGILLAAFVAVAPRPLPTGHMSPHLSYISGPDVEDLAPDAVHQACIFTVVLGIPCYGPAEMTRVYDFPSKLDGTGQTIVIVDAYGSPTIQSDLMFFDKFFSVPAPPSLTEIDVPGTGTPNPAAATMWGLETSLDVEYAHAMAPGAAIVLAIAHTDTNFDMNAAEAAVLPQYPGAIVSQSFGDWETDSTAGDSFAQQHQILLAASRLGDTLLASSGDTGATFTPLTHTTSPVLASYPASDPLVTAVGGTMGNPYPGGLLVAGAYGGESAWNEPHAPHPGATGGAPSVLFKAPSWQRGDTGYRTRTIPDVAYNAAILGGVEVFWTTQTPVGIRRTINLVGGTSAGTPQWAAIFALANQARAQFGEDALGSANRVLYKFGEQQQKGNGPAVFHDVTTGNNAFGSPLGFSATAGYDLATGWGSPDVSALVSALVGERAERNPEADEPHGGGDGVASGSMSPN